MIRAVMVTWRRVVMGRDALWSTCFDLSLSGDYMVHACAQILQAVYLGFTMDILSQIKKK